MLLVNKHIIHVRFMNILSRLSRISALCLLEAPRRCLGFMKHANTPYRPRMREM